METTNKIIIWEKWQDPFEQERNEWQDEEDSLYSDEDEDDLIKAGLNKGLNLSGIPPATGLITPIGFIPIPEHSRAGNVFNFWTIHSNFRITQSIMNIIDNTDGVETFDIYTPYRWRISIGKAFNTMDVKERVMNNLGATTITDT